MKLSYDLRNYSYEYVNQMLPVILKTNPSTIYLRSPLTSVMTEDQKTLPLHLHLFAEQREFDEIMELCREYPVKLFFDIVLNAMGTKSMPNNSLLHKYYPESNITEQLQSLSPQFKKKLTKKHFITKSSLFKSKTANNIPRFLNLNDNHVKSVINSMFEFLHQNGIKYINFVTHHCEDTKHMEQIEALIKQQSKEFEFLPSPSTTFNYQMIDNETFHIKIPHAIHDDIEQIYPQLDTFAFDKNTLKILNMMLENNAGLKYINTQGVYIFGSENKLLVINNRKTHYKLHKNYGKMDKIENKDVFIVDDNLGQSNQVNTINEDGYFNEQIIFDEHSITSLSIKSQKLK